MNTHAQALARLAGARAAHTLTPPAADLIAAILLRHGPDECRGVRHIQGTAECVFYRAALAAVGLKGSV